MKYLAAYVLLLLGGNESPSAEDITKLITSVGGEADDAKLTTLLSDLEGKDIHELLANGEKELKSVVGVAGPAAPSKGTDSLRYLNRQHFPNRLDLTGGAAPAAAAAAEPEKPKVEEVDALDGGMDMFGGSGGGGGDY